VTLGTIGGDGRPHLYEVWFLAADDTIRLSLNTSRQKVKNLQRNPACSVLILDPANLCRYLEIRGDTQIQPDADYEFADLVGRKHGANLREMDRPGESPVVVTIGPQRLRTWG
jgi:PPOX class probable F420-dependent enzyme